MQGKGKLGEPGLPGPQGPPGERGSQVAIGADTKHACSTSVWTYLYWKSTTIWLFCILLNSMDIFNLSRVSLVHLGPVGDVAKLDGGAAEDLQVMPWWASFRKMMYATRTTLDCFGSTPHNRSRSCCSVTDRTGRSVYSRHVRSTCCSIV